MAKFDTTVDGAGGHPEYIMTTKDLLEEYAGAYREVDMCDIDFCRVCPVDKERMQEIIKEIESSIRREVVMDFLELGEIVKHQDFIEAVKMYALSKGITLA